MEIHILTTGGTIGGLEYQDTIDKPEHIDMDIENFFKSANVSFEYEIDKVFDKDSRFITDENRKVLSEKIKLSIADKILITHGTLTMVETANFLGRMNLGKVVVLTGALVLGTNANTDAPFNLGFAISALKFLENGVYITMNGKIFDWNNVKKNLQTNQFETLS
ncbi:asparaginase domain-containing protein [Flavivirga rizhaonensis]|uniref:Asparaginase n=1 Tax=Flavivirga rizhaonensis TaxID=2559571 RepID=A0A4S1DZB3_9FLAO|nr:asparaginase domain-containing protein [Flavivirga rizhaonensis]TGV03355.1 asparaginase [Flavivirga rizhaonensis]